VRFESFFVSGSMNKFDRIQELHSILTNRRTPISLQDLAERMECAPSTVKRLINKFRNELGAPIVYERNRNGYLLLKTEPRRYEMPGLWFSVSELHALLTIHELLSRLQPGMLQAELTPFRQRIEKILLANKAENSELLKRVRIFNVAGRPSLPEHFSRAATATLTRKRLEIRYHSRSRNRITIRIISPQRIIYYRENWYLDGWCHQAEDLRTFSFDRIRKSRLIDQATIEISDEDLDDHFTPAYGLFAGPINNRAVLKFQPQRARWVADEQWHPDQKGNWHDDGSYTLEIPYSDSCELLLDILKYGPDVEVLEPKELRDEVRNRLNSALKNYE